MSDLLKKIEYHRGAMYKSAYHSKEWFFHMRVAAESVRTWRLTNTLEAVGENQ